MYIQFGAGTALFNPTGGNASTPSGPTSLLTLQDVDVKTDRKLVKLMGQNQGPDDVATSDAEVKITAGTGQINLDFYNTFFLGETIVTGAKLQAYNEAHTIPSSGPYTVVGTNTTALATNADMGVFYTTGANAGQPLERVASGPVTGQYSVAVSSGTITYTFAAADEGLGVVLNYVYTVTTGRTATLYNRLQGFGPYFELYLGDPYQSSSQDAVMGLHFFKCKIGNFDLPKKRNNYEISKIEIEAYPSTPLTGSPWVEWFDTSLNVL
jgi:hypothetical protein